MPPVTPNPLVSSPPKPLRSIFAAAGSSFLPAVLISIGGALVVSLQFLAQPWVWRNWPLPEIVEGWLFVFRDRLVVTVSIATATVLSSSLAIVSLRLRTLSLAVSVVVGALLGEVVVRLLNADTLDLASLAGYAMHWGALALAVAATFYLWRSSSDSDEQLRTEALRRHQIHRQLANTRLAALSGQIEPHFLFNTLATLRRLHSTEPEAGARMLTSFIDYLQRISPMVERNEVPLGDEIDLISAFLSVVAIRMGGRLQVRIDVPAALWGVSVPPLSIATLVENSVKHGVAPATDGGTITVRAHDEGGQLVVSVADTGVGLTQGCGSGTGIGLFNLRARLTTLYGNAGSLRVAAANPRGVDATMRLPCRRCAA